MEEGDQATDESMTEEGDSLPRWIRRNRGTSHIAYTNGSFTGDENDGETDEPLGLSRFTRRVPGCVRNLEQLQEIKDLGFLRK